MALEQLQPLHESIIIICERKSLHGRTKFPFWIGLYLELEFLAALDDSDVVFASEEEGGDTELVDF